jgi:RHS repeat-associated protein
VSTTYTYDALRRLVKLATAGQPSVAFTYDADGARIKKVVGTGGSAKTTTYLNDKRALAQVLQETGPNAKNVIRTLSYVPGLLQHDSSSSTWLYQHADALSNRVLTDGSQAIANRWSYDPFGAIRGPDSDDAKSEFGFAGEQKDAETGLINLRARYYDPALGRFLQRDPAPASGTYPQALNRYSYGINNPIRVIDPSGLTCGSYYDTEGCDDDGGDISVGPAVGPGGGDEGSGTGQNSGSNGSGSGQQTDNASPSVTADSNGPVQPLIACVKTPASEQEYDSSCSGYAGPALNEEEQKQAITLAREVCQMAGEACEELTVDEALAVIAASATIQLGGNSSPTGVQELSSEVGPGLLVASIIKLRERGPGVVNWIALATALANVAQKPITNTLERLGKFRAYWGRASLGETLDRFFGQGYETVESATKSIFQSSGSDFQVIYDKAGNYFRVYDSKHQEYVTQYGSRISNNVLDLITSKASIRLRDFDPPGARNFLRESFTHFINTDVLPN